MTRKSYILLTALLVVTHAFAVPWHIITEHAPGHVHHSEEGAHLHVHGPEAPEAHHHHHDTPSVPCPPEVFDASSYGPAHHHPGHAHSVTDHGMARKRIAPISYTPVAIAPEPEHFVQPPALLFITRTEVLLPALSPRHKTTTLRGPPVC